MSKKEIKHFRRYRGYDYSRGAALFITIVTNPRRRLFGQIVNAKLVKTQLGEEVEKALIHEAAHTRGIRLYKYVVMPDHVHFRVYLEKGFEEPLKVIGGFVRRFKTWTTRCWKLQAGLATQDGRTLGFAARSGGDLPESRAPLGGLWQQGYHDWLCLSEEMIAAVGRYIDYNPLKFELRYNQPEFLAIRDRRVAIIARGNSEIEFSRSACLEVNDEARRIATQGNAAQALLSGQRPGGEWVGGGANCACRGKAIYWLSEGPTLLS